MRNLSKPVVEDGFSGAPALSESAELVESLLGCLYDGQGVGGEGQRYTPRNFTLLTSPQQSHRWSAACDGDACCPF